MEPQGNETREFAARRRDLEREFDDKLRDLKAQHKRQADKLQQDRLDWEEHRRGKLKELADREEKVRRQEANAAKVERLKLEERKELEALRERNRDLEAAVLKASAKSLKLEERVSTARGSLSPTRHVLAWFAALSVLAPLTWLAFAWRTAGTPAVVVAAASLMVGLLLNAWRWRIQARGRRTHG